MSESIGYRRLGEAILNDRGISRPVTPEELPDPSEFDHEDEVVAVARFCRVLLRQEFGDEFTEFHELGWSGQSVKMIIWPPCDDPECPKHCGEMIPADMNNLPALKRNLEENESEFRWVSFAESPLFEPHQHPEVSR